jgi:CARDB
MKRIFFKITCMATGIALTAISAIAETPTLRAATATVVDKGILKGAGSPDLIIEPRYAGSSGLPGTGFCGPWNGGNQRAYFYVTNIGSEPAPASDAYVGFGGNLVSMVAIPALQPGQSTLRNTLIPIEAWGPSQIHGVADFLIAADHNDEVPEGNVSNNYGEGTCIGPAG